MAKTKFEFPGPYFGGKRKIASLCWELIGDCNNTIEPFAGSAAWTLARPHPGKIETINDADVMVTNWWRAVKADPVAVAAAADYPVSEVDMHAIHRWLVIGDDAKAFRKKMRKDPDYFDVKRAGRWVWGLSIWIGAGWCRGGETEYQDKTEQNIRPRLTAAGVAKSEPHLSKQVPLLRDGSRAGVNKVVKGPASGSKMLVLGSSPKQGRPQLADAYSRGRGVHSNDAAGTCAERRQFLLEWFQALADRLRPVRICCGDWKRVCWSPSVTTRLGLTGVFLDPPYLASTGRKMGIYAEDSGNVADEVRAYCLERGTDKLMRIILCGLEGEHNELEQHGWTKIAWKAPGGYNNRNPENQNAKLERLWVSPHCLTRKARGFGI